MPEENKHISAFQLFLALHPISEEFRRSVAFTATTIAEAYSSQSEDLGSLGSVESFISDERIDQLIDEGKS